MRSQFLIALLLVIVAAGTYWYQAGAYECPVPLSYRIGDIDPSFSLSFAEAQARVAEAEAVWETAAGRELFVYDDEAVFTVNFVFDDRQAMANSEAAERAELDAERARNEEVRENLEFLQAKHLNLSAVYEEQVASYESRLNTYNLEVQQYNDRGGAPADVFEALEAERVALRSEADALSVTAEELNGLAREINQLGQRGNVLVEQYNEEVNEYNEAYGFEREFTQGDYQGGEINIYKFSSDSEVTTVLAHEFGHALGIGHVEDDESLMYYLLDETDMTPDLSTDDLQAFTTVCGESETFSQRLRFHIRSLLAAF